MISIEIEGASSPLVFCVKLVLESLTNACCYIWPHIWRFLLEFFILSIQNCQKIRSTKKSKPNVDPRIHTGLYKPASVLIRTSTCWHFLGTCITCISIEVYKVSVNLMMVWFAKAVFLCGGYGNHFFFYFCDILYKFCKNP